MKNVLNASYLLVLYGDFSRDNVTESITIYKFLTFTVLPLGNGMYIYITLPSVVNTDIFKTMYNGIISGKCVDS